MTTVIYVTKELGIKDYILFFKGTTPNFGLQLAESMEENRAIGILLNIIFVSATYGYVRPAVGRVR